MALDNERRRLGTESGRMRREARRIERAGGDPSRMLNLASEQKLREGSAISSAEGNMRREQYMDRLQRGQAELARRSILGSTDPARTPTTTSGGLSRAPTPTTGAYRNDQGSSMGWTNTSGTGAAPAPTATPSPTPSPMSRINGQPASVTLDRMRRNPQVEPSFGRDIATKNLEELGLEGAVADYQQRASAPPVPVLPESPGNMRQVREQKDAAVKKSLMQPALVEAKKRRDPSAIAGPEPVWPPRPHLR